MYRNDRRVWVGTIVCHIQGLTKIYYKTGHCANKDITLEIQQGEIFGLLGPNGAGKSTLVSQIAGLTRPTYGSIKLFGIDVLKQPEYIAHIVALQPQQSTALRHLSVEEAIFYTARLRGIEYLEAQKQTVALIDELGLGPLRKKRISTLSGGQNKLINVAIALVGNCPLQIFDEPTNELDPENRKLIWDKLLQQNKRGTTILLVTHNVLEAERVVQRVGIINDGLIVALGSVGELKARIDQYLQIELLLKDIYAPHTNLAAHFQNTTRLSGQHWVLRCYRHELQETMNSILSLVDMQHIDDIRVTTPSLEDVYLQLGGGQTLA